MGRKIEPQAKQIILKVIQFCEIEKKNGLLAPRHQAIKRACLATGMSKYTILKIKKEGRNSASIEGYELTSEDVSEDQMFDEDELEGDMDPGPSTGFLHDSNSLEAPESGVQPPSSPMETVRVKMEPMDNIQEDSTPIDVGFDVKCEYKSDPEYDVPLKKPQEGFEDDHSIVVKCEFEATDDPLIPASERERIEQEGASKWKNDSPNKENSSKKKKHAQSTGRYQCHICHKQLSTLSKLKTHVTLHSGDKPFTCSVCQSKYSHEKGLQRHMKTHTDKQYECSICKKRFMENSKLNRHLKSHTGEKPFGCQMCERRFIRNEELQIHTRTHTGEKPYECSVCHTKFTQKSTLHKHLITHTGKKTHECSICHSWFARSSSLQIHSRIHTGEKPYECNLCQSRFAQSIHLHRHLRKHGIGEKLFECDICQCRYNEKSQLRAHIQTH